MGKDFVISLSRLAEDDTIRSDPTLFQGLNGLSDFLNKKNIAKQPLKHDMIHIRNGTDVKQTEYSLRPTKFFHISVSEIREYGLDLSDPTYLLDDCGIEISNSAWRNGDIVITGTGSVGVTFVFRQTDSNVYILSRYLLILRIDESKIFPPFITYYLNSSVMKTFFKTYSAGKNTQNITQKVIEKIPSPPLTVLQQKIIFDDLEKIDDEIKDSIKKIPDIQMIIQQIFEEQLGFLPLEKYFPQKNVMVRSGLTDIAKNENLRISAKYNYFWKF